MLKFKGNAGGGWDDPNGGMDSLFVQLKRLSPKLGPTAMKILVRIIETKNAVAIKATA